MLHFSSIFLQSPLELNLCKQIKKSVSLEAWSGPEVSRKLRFPDFMTTAQDGGRVVSLTHRPPLPPGNANGTHFCYRLSRNQGQNAIGRIMSIKTSITPAGIEPAVGDVVPHHQQTIPLHNTSTPQVSLHNATSSR